MNLSLGSVTREGLVIVEHHLKRFVGWIGRILWDHDFAELRLARSRRLPDPKLPLVVKEDFEQGLGRWQTTDPDPADSVWRIVEPGQASDHALRMLCRLGVSEMGLRGMSPFHLT